MSGGTCVLFEGLSVKQGNYLASLDLLHLSYEAFPVFLHTLSLLVRQVRFPTCQLFGVLLPQLLDELDQQLMSVLLVPPSYDLDPFFENFLELFVVIGVFCLFEGKKEGSDLLLSLLGDWEVGFCDYFKQHLKHCGDIAGVAKVREASWARPALVGAEPCCSFLRRAEAKGRGVSLLASVG